MTNPNKETKKQKDLKATTASKGKKKNGKTDSTTTTTTTSLGRRNSSKGSGSGVERQQQQHDCSDNVRRSIKRTNSRDDLPKSPPKRRSSLDMTIFETSPTTTRSKSKSTGLFFTPPWNRASLSNAKGFPAMPSFASVMSCQPLGALSSFDSLNDDDDDDNLDLDLMSQGPDESNSVASSSSPTKERRRIVSPNAVVSSNKSPVVTSSNKTCVTPKGSPVSSPDAVGSDEIFFNDDGYLLTGNDNNNNKQQPSFDEIFNSWENNQADDAEIRFGKQEESFESHPPNVFFEQCLKAKVAELRKVPNNREKRQMARDLIHAFENSKGLVFSTMVDPLEFDGVESMPLSHEQALLRVLEKLRHHLAEDSKRRTQNIENKRLRDEHLLTPQEKQSLDQLALLQKGQVEKAIALITIPDFDVCLQECYRREKQGGGNTAAKDDSESHQSSEDEIEPKSPRNTKKKAGAVVKKNKKKSNSNYKSPSPLQADDDELTIEEALSMTDAQGQTTTANSRKAMRSNMLRKKQVRKGKRPAKNGTSNVEAALPDAIGSTDHSNNNNHNNHDINAELDDLLLLAEEMGNCSMTSFEDDMSFFDEGSLVRSFSGGSWASSILASAPAPFAALSH